jgi:hypothetical protein
MKTMKQLTVLLAALLLVAGCAKSKSQETANNTNVVNNGGAIVPPVVIDPLAPINTGSTQLFSSGSTVAFNPVSLNVMNTYVATHPLNNPSNFKLNINLATSGNSRYGGDVTISYTDNGVQYDGIFKAGMGKNQSFKGMYDNDRLESDYNYWFNFERQLVFTGMFEDQYGAITISLIPLNGAPASGNDGEPITSGPYKGYVYFKNFQTTFAPHSPYRSCWFTYMGPYDCRSNVIQTKCGLEPGAGAGYQLLGTFSGVDIKKAFNIQ